MDSNARMTLTYSKVHVELPMGVRTSEAEEDWQEVSWVSLSTGDLLVVADSELVFKYADTKVKPKPLGSLLRASTVPGADDSCLVVDTSDSHSSQFRFTFSSASDATSFKQLADKIVAAHEARRKREANVSSRGEDVGAMKLAQDIQDKFRREGRLPLVFRRADFFGVHPDSPDAGEVRLGRGAFVLLDPREEDSRTTIGEYALLFFSEDDGAKKEFKKIPIGPRMSLKKQPLEDDDPDGPAAIFELRQGPQVYSLAFDEDDVALAFARDFRVRSRLMDISLKTAKGQHAIGEAHAEMLQMERRSCSARLGRFLRLMLLLMWVVVLIRTGLHVRENPGQEPKVYIDWAKQDLMKGVMSAGSHLRSAGSTVCELAVGAVPASSLERCLQPGGVSQVRECLLELVNIGSS